MDRQPKSLRTQITRATANFNVSGLRLHWPRLWIILLALMLFFLCLCIVGMEVGHTIYDLRRSTAFGGFILFIPLSICAHFVFITGKFHEEING